MGERRRLLDGEGRGERGGEGRRVCSFPRKLLLYLLAGSLKVYYRVAVFYLLGGLKRP